MRLSRDSAGPRDGPAGLHGANKVAMAAGVARAWVGPPLAGSIGLEGRCDRYRVGMALATPVPAEGTATSVDDDIAGSSLPPNEVALLVPVLQSFLRRHPDEDTELIVRAAETATVAHAGQLRRSGEPYITHPIAVAGIVADLGLDAQTVAAALLHDAVEDTGITTEVIDRDFGSAVALIVDGVTKLDRLQFDSKEAQQAATVRKMLVAMANDWRVLIIKLADRLHNMRTLSVMPEWKQRRTAQETLDIYAPLAHRLGIQEVKWQLEDLAFATLHPKRYTEIEQMVASRAPLRDEFLARVLVAVRERLAASGVTAEVTGRPKHLWSIYEKMVVRGKEFDDLYDLVGIRVIVESEKDCWAALGSIHAIWSPVQGRFKDYINSPKFNLYQSCTPPSSASTAIPSRYRSGPTRCTAVPNTASLRTGATRRTRPGLTGLPLAGRAGHVSTTKSRGEAGKSDGTKKASSRGPTQPRWSKETGGRNGWRWPRRRRRPRPRSSGCSASSTSRTRRPIRSSSSRPSSSTWRKTRYTSSPPRARSSPSPPTPPLSTSPTPSTPKWAPLYRGQGQRAARPARYPAQLGRHGGDLHVEGADRRTFPRLAVSGGIFAGPHQDPAVVLP